MREKANSLQRSAPRLALSLGAAATLLSTALCGQAQADDGPSGISDYQGARQVLQSRQVHTVVSRFFGATANVGADGGTGAAAPMAPGAHNDQQTFSLKDPVALYELAPEFVTGRTKPTAGNVSRLSYLAARANDASGHKATVLLSSTAKSGGGSGDSWHLTGVRDGDSDVTYGQKATGGSKVFTEPQIHAWYRLKNNTVEPLNREATAGLGGKRAVTLADYQKLVHGRYADKLPGSAYDRKGLAGGFGPASKPSASSASSEPSSPSSAPMQLGASGVVAAALVGGATAVRLRNRRRTQGSATGVSST
ncbi:hypothetical protein [Streptomyces chattanoogensis]|uniref:Uncharacterized protein n=1 Tax=Streptomyces chattanoogensis TaxID=66876 RepID=A0A0N1JYP2_9ACTN|nr:hypothetical protein [Streptomyces chattanoogensis]KPC64353.1 hypothetical protein ADL29_12650 [Streptomyces chattanoogensis]